MELERRNQKEERSGSTQGEPSQRYKVTAK